MPITGPNRDDKDKANYSEFVTTQVAPNKYFFRSYEWSSFSLRCGCLHLLAKEAGKLMADLL
jgi:hypothetical protein